MTQAEKMRHRAAALLARADEVERKELARRGNLVLFGDIERALVSSAGLSAATIAWTNRILRQGGVLEARARGRSAESITVSQAAIHVIALLAFEKGRTTAEATATLLGSEIGKEVGVRPHDTLIGQNTLGDIVTAILALLAEDDATIEFTVNRSDLSAMVTIEIAGQRWSAFFPPRRECAGDYRELAAFTEATFRALAALYTGDRP